MVWLWWRRQSLEAVTPQEWPAFSSDIAAGMDVPSLAFQVCQSRATIDWLRLESVRSDNDTLPCHRCIFDVIIAIYVFLIVAMSLHLFSAVIPHSLTLLPLK